MKQYYICKPDRTQEGPYPEEMVRTSYEQGIFPANTLIWFDGAAEWMPIQNIFADLRTAPKTPSASNASTSVADPDKAAISATLIEDSASIHTPPAGSAIPTPQPVTPVAPPDFEASPYPVPPTFPLQEEATYHVALPGMQPQGPYTRTSVITGYNQGDYPHGSKVWGPDTGDWVPISNLAQVAAPLNPMENAMPMQIQSWNPLTAFVSGMKRYAQFSGRASRSEFFFFYLAWLILAFIFIMLGAGGLTVGFLMFDILHYGSLVPSIAVTARRFHDTGRSGWLMLIPFYACVIVCLPSKNGNNPYGTAPLPPA